MAPALIAEAARRTQRAGLRTGVAGTAFALHLQVQFMRLGRCVQVLTYQLPRWLDTNPQQQNLVAPRAIAPLRIAHPSMAQQLTAFHKEPEMYRFNPGSAWAVFFGLWFFALGADLRSKD